MVQGHLGHSSLVLSSKGDRSTLGRQGQHCLLRLQQIPTTAVPRFEDSCHINHKAERSLTSTKGPALSGFFPWNPATEPATLLTSHSPASLWAWVLQVIVVIDYPLKRFISVIPFLRSDDPAQADLELSGRRAIHPSGCRDGCDC